MSDYRECPYDPLHKIAAKTFALHLVKCKRQHPDVNLVRCHFDTSHLMKEEKLKEHMKTCSGRKDLLQYKVTVNNRAVASGFKLPDPADELIYNTAGPSNQKGTGGVSLQDDSECWDDFAYKAYDPLENCKSKMKNDKSFILPNANSFAGQMQAAAALKEIPAEVVPDGSLMEHGARAKNACSTENCDSTPHEERQHDRTDDCGSNNHGTIVKQEPSDYESESAGYDPSSKHHKDRDFGASSSSRRNEVHRINSEERSYRSRDRSRSDSSRSSDRKSYEYNGYYDGHTYHGSYESSRSRHHRDKYEVNRNSSYRGGNERHTDSDSSNRSYSSSKHKYKPYQRYT